MNEQGDDGDFSETTRWNHAIRWYITLRDRAGGDLTCSVGRQWQQWYSHPVNKRLFNDVERLLGGSDGYRKRDRPSKEQVANDRYDLSVPIAEWLRSLAQEEIPVGRSSVHRKMWLGCGVAGLAAAAAAAVLLLVRPWSGEASPATYQTEIGGLRHIELMDGSSITLGGLTKLSVAFTAKRRSIILVKGQAWFKVAHDTNWPFVVAAGKGTITDAGTAFLVTRESDRVVVTVTEGMVEVAARDDLPTRRRVDLLTPTSPRVTSIRVQGGERLTLRDDGVMSRLEPTDARAATAWTRGRLLFDDQPLRYVVETVDRYSHRRITVSLAAGGLRVSGIVFENDIHGWLQNLEVVLPVTVRDCAGGVCIQMRADKRVLSAMPEAPRP